jgi:hypothetical protein
MYTFLQGLSFSWCSFWNILSYVFFFETNQAEELPIILIKKKTQTGLTTVPQICPMYLHVLVHRTAVAYDVITYTLFKTGEVCCYVNFNIFC